MSSAWKALASSDLRNSSATARHSAVRVASSDRRTSVVRGDVVILTKIRGDAGRTRLDCAAVFGPVSTVDDVVVTAADAGVDDVAVDVAKLVMVMFMSDEANVAAAAGVAVDARVM